MYLVMVTVFSIVSVLNYTVRRVAQLKNKICNHVFNNWASFEGDVHACHNSSLTKSTYLNFMLVQRNWASACEIKAASEILNQPIKVFLTGRAGTKLVYNKSLYVPTHCHLTPPITLLLSNGHFQLLKRSVMYVIMITHMQQLWHMNQKIYKVPKMWKNHTQQRLSLLIVSQTL